MSTGKWLSPAPSDVEFDDVAEHRPYHSTERSRIDTVAPEQRQFIAWDGEGINRKGPGKPQAYVLFGCSTGEHISSTGHLHTFEILDFIVGIGERNPSAFHVGFAFNYDANMIVQSLNPKSLKALHENGRITLNRPGVGKYHIQFRPSKWFSVSRFQENYDKKKNPHAKTTVRIYDLFGFFGKSFIRAYEDLVGPVPEVVTKGKANRGQFDRMDETYIETYWRAEIEMLRELAEELRRRLYGAGLRVTQWHGPGALASYALRQHQMKQYMGTAPDPVREAARYAYAGGRFEIFRLGRITGNIYSIDINSAYPNAIRKLPSLSAGYWSHCDGAPAKLAYFGVYRVRLIPHRSDSWFERTPGPLFHRDKMGNISFPWILEGWYWSPEVRNLLSISDRYEIVEGWEYLGFTSQPPPFKWVEESYEQRRIWKDEGLGAELALKLMLNSLYGKMAQRVGWNQEKALPPTWHQLEWAGWVTSYTRAMLWKLMAQIPVEQLIAVETDGLYTTVDPSTLGIQASKNLGEWSVDAYDEILYVQSGMAWLRSGNCQSGCLHSDSDRRDKRCAWTSKRRGLDARTFSLNDCRDYLDTLKAGPEWAPFVGETTRFIGLGAALNGSAPLKVRHCVWDTREREIRPGQNGKRVHLYKQCHACRDGLSAWDAAHDMSIRSGAYMPGGEHSSPHDIPWEGEQIDREWREYTRDLGESIVD
jgi:hypothetical protein